MGNETLNSVLFTENGEKLCDISDDTVYTLAAMEDEYVHKIIDLNKEIYLEISPYLKSISKKRFIKLLMSHGFERNLAYMIAKLVPSMYDNYAKLYMWIELMVLPTICRT